MDWQQKNRGKAAAAHSDRLAALREGITVEHFSWGHVDMEKLRMLCFAACSTGAAFMISPADGGEGVCVTLFVDGGKVKQYARNAARLHQIIARYVQALGVDAELAMEAAQITDKLASMPAD